MPVLEAPTEECSSERSISPELVQAAAVPVAMGVHIYVQSPEPRPNEFFQPLAPHQLPLRNERVARRNFITPEDPPPFVHLLPVTLPPQLVEPTLDELLRRVTERNDLQNVERVRLRVISYTISLSRLALFLPRLQHLDLNGSVLNSLRDLGCGLINLSHLNVSNCGLNSFDGIGTGTPAVRVLIADGNMIQRVGPLAELPLLQQLSVQNNCISDLGLLTFLGICPNLVELDLRGNPVCHLTLYRVTVQRSVCLLQSLDGVTLHHGNSAVTANVPVSVAPENNSSTEDELSSLSSDVLSESGAMAMQPLTEDSPQQRRPATAPQEPFSSEEILHSQAHRPASVSGTTRRQNSLPLSVTPIMVGSVLNLARRHRRGSNHAWLSSSSSSSLSSRSINSSSPTSSGGSVQKDLAHRRKEDRM